MAASAQCQGHRLRRRRPRPPPSPAADLGRHLLAATATLLLLAQLAPADCQARRKYAGVARDQLQPPAPAAEAEPFCLQESVSGELSAEGFDATWVGESKLFHAKGGQMVLTDVNTNESTVVVPQVILQQYQPEIMSLSPDERFVLMGYNVRKVYRHSSEANYTIYNIQENTTLDVCDEALQLAKWAPVGRGLVFVLQNNVYYIRQPGAQTVALTTDGVPGLIYNGVADWVYEEEVLASDTALWWSPDGMQVAFARFDDSQVHNFSYIHYGTPGKIEYQYSEVVTLRYPKPGTPNPRVQLKVAVVETWGKRPGGKRPKQRQVSVKVLSAPTDVVTDDHILYSVTWAGRDKLLASWANRVGNVVQFVSYSMGDGSTPVMSEPGLKLTRPNGWLDVTPALFKRRNDSTYVTISWEKDEEEDTSFPQVVAVTKETTKALTSGRATVTEIYGWDNNGYVWYQATEALEPTASLRCPRPSRRHVFAVREGGSPFCLSCNLTSPEGHRCRHAAADFSSDYSWVAVTCSGPMDPPVVTLIATAGLFGTVLLGSQSHQEMQMQQDIQLQQESQTERASSTTTTTTTPASTTQSAPPAAPRKIVWTDNAELRQKLAPKAKPTLVDTWVEVGSGLKAQVRMMLPPGLDTTGAEQRPALVHVYAGPGSQQISDEFKVGFQDYIVTYRRYIYIYIDGRGSGYKGDQMLFSVNRHLGNLEIQDQINVTRLLKQKFPYIDGSRVAIWGWSYGGYAAAATLAEDVDNVFRCGASVAPVSSWIYYDSIYTERYMGLPNEKDNEVGYKDSDVTRRAMQFLNKTYFLIHGTGDDNVHYQHSMMLARALEDAGVIFRQQSYPDQDHSMGALREHLYASLDEFMSECFSQDGQPQPTPTTSSASRMGGGLLVPKRVWGPLASRHMRAATRQWPTTDIL